MSKTRKNNKARLGISLAAPDPEPAAPQVTLQDVPIAKIVVERNPRKRFDEESLLGLAQSIRERGLQQPIILEPGDGDLFILVSGERRLRAHKKLGKTTIQAILRARTNHDGRERFLDAIIENDQRADMTHMELGRAYRSLQDDFEMSMRDISKRIGRSEKHISDHIRLTQLDPEIQAMIDQGFWHDIRLANKLLKVWDRDARIELAKHLFNHKVSLKGCLNAVDRTIQTLAFSPGRSSGFGKGTPALKLLEAQEQPRHWGMLQQLGQVPPWTLVVLSAEKTCDACPLRSMASIGTCRECGAVHLLRKMIEAAK